MQTAYEAIYIIDTNLPDEQRDAIINKYADVITRTGGTVDDIDRWDPRRLAYEIKGRREGVYIIVNFTSEAASCNELTRIFGISDDTIRSMIVKQDKRADRFPSRTRANEMERREREMAARAAAMPQRAPVAEQAAPADAPQTITDLPPAGGESADASAVDTPVGAAAVEDNATAAVPAVAETAAGANEPATTANGDGPAEGDDSGEDGAPVPTPTEQP